MTNPQPSSGGLTPLGKIFSLVLVLGLLGLGAWVVMKRQAKAPGNPTTQTAAATGAAPRAFDTSDIVEADTSVPKLDPPMAYTPAAGAPIDMELSKYAGYAGLIAANGGLETQPGSFFAGKNLKLRIKLSEEESWNALNAGKMAASATTADVLAVYGRQFQVVVPAQIGYSRGADGLVVRNDIRKVNDLKGKIVASSQFTESDFFIRYLAKEAGISIKMISSLTDPLDAEAINVVYCGDGEKAGKLFVKSLNANSNALAGCVTWAPFTTDIPSQSGGKAKLLVSNKNLLLVADILIVNKGFAEKNPGTVQTLVDGLVAGNGMIRNTPDAGTLDAVARALGWDRNKLTAELQKVHLANLPEQVAFFNAGITQGGSFASIYQSAILDYGNDLIPNAVDSDRFLALDALKQIDASGRYKGEAAAIVPLSSGAAAPAESDPVLSKDIRFLFQPNSSKLDMSNKENLANLNAIKRILDVSPGSKIILVGHVDNARIPELRRTGGQALVDKTALDAIQLSKERATEVMNQVIAHEKADPKRLEIVGKGWSQPVSQTDPERNRRVEVQWFTLE